MKNQTNKSLHKLTRNEIFLARKNYILYRLRGRGFRVIDLAKHLGVTPQAVTNSFNSPYPRIERAISEILHDSIQHLFPERYDSSGIRILPNKRFKKISQFEENKKARNRQDANGI